MTKLSPGAAAPDFTLVDQDERPVSLRELRGVDAAGESGGGRSVILFFYPAAMTPGCTKEACDFRDSLAPLQEAGYAVVGISRDAPAKLRAFRERDGLTYDLLSDPDHAVHEAYGAWGEKNLYGKVHVGVIRSTFVINGDGRIDRAMYNVKAKGHVAKLRGELGV